MTSHISWLIFYRTCVGYDRSTNFKFGLSSTDFCATKVGATDCMGYLASENQWQFTQLYVLTCQKAYNPTRGSYSLLRCLLLSFVELSLNFNEHIYKVFLKIVAHLVDVLLFCHILVVLNWTSTLQWHFLFE